MRVYVLGTMFGILVAAMAAADVLRAPLTVDHVSPLPEHANLPLIAIGRLPDGSPPAVDWSKLDDSNYASFRDNQLGKNDQADWNAADYAAGKLRLLPPAESREVIVAVAVPDLPDTAVTIGPVLLDGSVLRIVAEQWEPETGIARSKTTNARALHVFYLPPLPAGAYRMRLEWRMMSPARPDEGSDYSLTETRVAELPFQVQPAGRRLANQATTVASLPASDKAMYARIIGPVLGHDEWVSVGRVRFSGDAVNYQCRAIWESLLKEPAMDRLLTMDAQAFANRMQAEFQRVMKEVADAVNAAPTGNVISGSEMRVRDLMAEFRREAFETAVQMRIDSTESSFSPSHGRDGQAEGQQGAGRAKHSKRQRPDRVAAPAFRHEGSAQPMPGGPPGG